MINKILDSDHSYPHQKSGSIKTLGLRHNSTLSKTSSKFGGFREQLNKDLPLGKDYEFTSPPTPSTEKRGNFDTHSPDNSYSPGVRSPAKVDSRATFGLRTYDF